MLLQPSTYHQLVITASAIPLLMAIAMYLYIYFSRFNKSIVFNMILFMLSAALFFSSVYLWAYMDDIYPFAKVWVIKKNSDTLVKQEKISFFNSEYVFQNGDQSNIETHCDSVVVNDTEKQLLIVTGIFADKIPPVHVLNDLKNETWTIMPRSTACVSQLDYFGYGSEKPPLEKLIQVSNYPDLNPSHGEKYYWIRW